jgi:hypothetical protein
MYIVYELGMSVVRRTTEEVPIGTTAVADDRRISQRAVTHTSCPRKLFSASPEVAKYVKYIFFLISCCKDRAFWNEIV